MCDELGYGMGIIGAMDAEVKAIQDLLENKTITEHGGLQYVEGSFGKERIVVVKCGIGKVNAALCAQYLLNHFNVELIINTGIAGACAKGLNVYDFVVSTKAVYHDVDVTNFGYEKGQLPGLSKEFVADDFLVEKTIEAFNNSEFSKNHKIIKGVVASGDQFICSKEVKEQIIKDFAPACVEMEGAAIAHACVLNNRPYVIIRCMSDCADDTASSTYDFNEEDCANRCAKLVLNLIELL